MKKNSNIERISYSVQEASDAIGISSRTLHDFIKDGSIAHFRMGTRVFIPTDALRQFIERRTQQNLPTVPATDTLDGQQTTST